jgi:hypothetical protein
MDISTKEHVLIIDGSSGSEWIEEEMAQLLVHLFDVFKQKQASYGKGNIADFGEMGVLIRANDKISRLKNLLFHNKENPLSDESIEDTWIDLADYALIALLVRSGAWEKI